MKIAKGNVRKIIWKVSEIQQLIGRAEQAFLNDRRSDTADVLLPTLQEAFDLCIEITGMYAPVYEPPNNRVHTDALDSPADCVSDFDCGTLPCEMCSHYVARR